MATNPLLQAIVEKPAMYFGNRDGYLRDIEAFDIGYATAAEVKRIFIPVAFKEYIIHLAYSDSRARHRRESRVGFIQTIMEGL